MKWNQLSWANKVPSPPNLATITSWVFFFFFFPTRKGFQRCLYIWRIIFYVFSNQNIENNFKTIHPLRSRNQNIWRISCWIGKKMKKEQKRGQKLLKTKQEERDEGAWKESDGNRLSTKERIIITYNFLYRSLPTSQEWIRGEVYPITWYLENAETWWLWQ